MYILGIDMLGGGDDKDLLDGWHAENDMPGFLHHPANTKAIGCIALNSPCPDAFIVLLWPFQDSLPADDKLRTANVADMIRNATWGYVK